MSVTVGDVMRECRNYFELPAGEGLPADAAWAAIEGVGVCRVADGLPAVPEGARVWALYPPEDFLRLCALIAASEAATPEEAFRSERFGDYSCTRSDTRPLRWASRFAAALRPWRHMFTEVSC